MTTKPLNTLQIGDKVLTVADTVLDEPRTVVNVRTATLRSGKVVPTFVVLDNGGFWPTGKTDPRTVTVA